MIRVTAGILIKNGKVLIAQRRSGGKLAGKWEFPGGKIEGGETPEECLKRELREELQIETSVGELMHKNRHEYDFGCIELLAYWAEWVGGQINPIEHDSVLWVPIQDLQKYDLAPADIPIAEKLLGVRK
jgi:8-oxo-dGTP diphosphatase